MATLADRKALRVLEAKRDDLSMKKVKLAEDQAKVRAQIKHHKQTK
jgi:hypothetical protein